MARTTPGVTRDKLLTEAVRLFARRGYSATSVADIQVACGLTPGSGALYKHFRSKQDLLAAAVRHSLTVMAERELAANAALPADPRDALRLLAQVVFAVLDAERDLVRLMIREFDAMPELFAPMWDAVLAHVYDRCAEWIRQLCEQGRAEVADPVATSAVLVAALTYHPILDLLIGHTPGEVDRERYLTAWLEHAAGALRLR